MTAVFSHGRLRLYLLTMLAEGPRHGYEMIRLLEERFEGRYAPSAGTIYPRLARLEAEGLVTHTATGGRKVYEITGAGREELRLRDAEVHELEAEIRATVADLARLAGEIGAEVRSSVRDLGRGLRDAASGAGWGVRPPQPRSYPPPESTAPLQRTPLERQVAEFVVELRGLVGRARVGAEEARAVAEALNTALATIRRTLSR